VDVVPEDEDGLRGSCEAEFDRREGDSEPDGEDVVCEECVLALLLVVVDVDADEDEDVVETFD